MIPGQGNTVPLLKFQMAPSLRILLPFRDQEKGAKICMFQFSKGFTLTQNVGWGFILSRPPTWWTTGLAPLSEDVFSEWDPKSVFEPVSNYYFDRATLPNAGYPPSISSFFLYSAYLGASKAMLYQWRHSGSLKRFQSRMAITANTNIFLWPSIRLIFINTSQDGLKDCTMLP